ncbi:Peptide chain release factor class I/class II [Corchorus olitorius]|uniref:Peptide chain release factor class I/class II n=1 Tax=Corchorus olitorius TaxID=93759 RepID=A0A1R3IE98_9ROSI|nr:Peptide chain release factor class I/class II [Corchorus olitorius]
MAVIRTSANMILKEILHHSPLSSSISFPSPARALLPGSCGTTIRVTPSRGFNFSRIRCAASDAGAEKKVSSRLSQVQQLLQEAEERASSAGNEPTPQITLDHVSVSFARSGGPGGQNVNKVNTKVDMRFNVKTAYWLSDRIRERIMQLWELVKAIMQKDDKISVEAEKNRINKDGEIVISSTKTRTQKGNIHDAMAKLQAIIDAAAYVPPPPSEEQKKKIAKMAAIGEQKRLKSKKVLSDKKAFRRSRDSWD